MEATIGERYALKEPVMTGKRHSVYRARDLALNRDVFLYIAANGKAGEAGSYLQRLGRVSGFDHEQFIHIFDAGLHEDYPYMVLKAYDGEPLLSAIERRNIDAGRILASVTELGKSLLEALEAGIQGFSVTADNVWVRPDGRWMIVNYWEEADKRRQGAAGLAALLVQCFTAAAELPRDAEALELDLRRHMPRLGTTPAQTERLIELLHRVLQGGESLSSFLFELREIGGSKEAAAVEERPRFSAGAAFSQPQQEPVRSAPPEYPAHRDAGAYVKDAEDEEYDEDEADEEDDDDRAGGRSRWRLRRVAAISVAFLCVLVVAAIWIRQSFQPIERESAAPPPPASAGADGSGGSSGGGGSAEAGAGREANAGRNGKPSEPDPMVLPEKPETDGDTVHVPPLVGLTRETAEKEALALQLKYDYFIEPSDQEQGTVFKQVPEPGTEVPKGTRITFYVSRGAP